MRHIRRKQTKHSTSNVPDDKFNTIMYKLFSEPYPPYKSAIIENIFYDIIKGLH